MRVALVDLDDTLVDYRSEEESGWQAVRRECLDEVPLDVWSTVYRRAKLAQRASGPATARSYVDRFALAVASLRDLGYGTPSEMSFIEHCNAVYWSARYACVRPLHGAELLLAVLRAESSRVLLCTSGATVHQVRRLRTAGLDGVFDAVITSEQAGRGKDDWPAFLGRWWNPDNEYLAISDSFEPDLSAALRCGMHTAWIRGEGVEIPPPPPEGYLSIDMTAPTPAALAALLAAAVERKAV